MPYLDSDIPSKIFYASFDSEILHVAKATSNLINMVTRANLLVIRMKKKGSQCICIILLLTKIFGKD